MGLDQRGFGLDLRILGEDDAHASDESGDLDRQRNQGFDQLDGGQADDVERSDRDRLELGDELGDQETDIGDVLQRESKNP